MRRATREITRVTEPEIGGPQPSPARPFMAARTRAAAIGLVFAAALAVGGLTAVRLLGAGDSADSAGAAGSATAGQPGGTSLALEAHLPEPVASPHTAAMPLDHASRSKTGSGVKPAPTGGRPATPSSPPPQPGTTGGSAPTAQAPTSASSGSATCQNPQYTTSDPTAMWNLAPYFVANDMWNTSGYNVTQTLYACSYSNWDVVATMDNSKGDGAVKTYPNSHRDFGKQSGDQFVQLDHQYVR